MRIPFLAGVALLLTVPACALVLGDFDKGPGGAAGSGGGGTAGSSSSAGSGGGHGGAATSGGTGGTLASTTSNASATTTATTTSSTSGTGGGTSSAGSATTASSAASSSGGTSGLSAGYLCGDATTPINTIRPYFEIYNAGPSPVALSTLTIRYYFTADGSTSLAFDCDFASPVGCANVAGTFATTSGTQADHYLEVSFLPAAGSISAGGNSGQIEVRFEDSAYAIMFDQTNDWSFDPTNPAYAPWARVTLYQNGTLVWGTEP
jgi:hypothetical protein